VVVVLVVVVVDGACMFGCVPLFPLRAFRSIFFLGIELITSSPPSGKTTLWARRPGK